MSGTYTNGRAFMILAFRFIGPVKQTGRERPSLGRGWGCRHRHLIPHKRDLSSIVELDDGERVGPPPERVVHHDSEPTCSMQYSEPGCAMFSHGSA